MPFSLSIFQRYTGTDPNRILTDNQWNAVVTSISSLAGDARVSSLFSGLSAISGAIIVAGAPSKPDDPFNGQKNAFWDQSSTSMLIGDLSYGGGVVVDSTDGATDISLEFNRLIFHELVHAKYADVASSSSAAFANEERAVFLENAVYRSSFGGGERVGHYGGTIGGLTTSSVSAVSYLAGMNLTNDVVVGEKGTFTFSAGDDLVKKTYHQYGVSVQASTSHSYDHYITISLSSSGHIFQENGAYSNSRMGLIAKGSIIDDALAVTSQAAAAHVSAIGIHGAANDAGLLNSAQSAAVDFGFYFFDQTQSLSLSAERFADSFNKGATVRDYHGLAAIGTDNTPDVIAIDGSLLSGAVIFGASGYARNGVTAATAWDDLRGGTGNDVLLAGSGNISSENVLAGGGGNDVLIGNIPADFLKGEAGKDLLVGGGGADKLDGGDGLDLVSYSESTVGVTIDLSLRQCTADLSMVVGLLTTGAVSDATGDRIANVEGIIGSSFNDTLTAGSETVVLYGADGNDTLVGGGGSVLLDGGGSILLGGEGDDKLYGGYGDTLIGGEGADKFYLSSTNGDVVTIFGLDSEDQIFIDDTLYTGATITATVSFKLNESGYHQSVEMGYVWYWTLESSSRFAPSTKVVNVWDASTPDVPMVDRPKAFDRFQWADGYDGSGTGDAYIEIQNYTPNIVDGYDEGGTFTHSLFINLEDYTYGNAGLSYNWWNEGFHTNNHETNNHQTSPMHGFAPAGGYEAVSQYLTPSDAGYTELFYAEYWGYG